MTWIRICVGANWNFDGSVNTADYTAFLNSYNADTALGRGNLSYIHTHLGGDNRKAYAGYELDPVLADADAATGKNWQGFYHVRNRVYLSQLGRWTRRDPLGYVDGMSVYLYGHPLRTSDPTGLRFGGPVYEDNSCSGKCSKLYPDPWNAGCRAACKAGCEQGSGACDNYCGGSSTNSYGGGWPWPDDRNSTKVYDNCGCCKVGSFMRNPFFPPPTTSCPDGTKGTLIDKDCNTSFGKINYDATPYKQYGFRELLSCGSSCKVWLSWSETDMTRCTNTYACSDGSTYQTTSASVSKSSGTSLINGWMQKGKNGQCQCCFMSTYYSGCVDLSQDMRKLPIIRLPNKPGYTVVR